MGTAQVVRVPQQQVTARSVVLAIADIGLRQRLRTGLTSLRWTVREAAGGADAMAQVGMDRPEALVVDSWLPDLEVGEFAGEMASLHPAMDVLRVDGSQTRGGVGGRSPRRNELLHALRQAQEGDGALNAWESSARSQSYLSRAMNIMPAPVAAMAIPELIGASPVMLDLTRLIRLVAPRQASVLIEGETGTGKEVVAKAVHRLSARAAKPFVVLNCAAIPESLLEAELFGHTRGAFTGAVQSRVGRIEAAHGGTLFLDEIGEMPLALQAKMLRFLDGGELQKVGDNDATRVDVRVIAATHQPLEQRAEERTFRLDLYHRLAVFPLVVSALRERMEDVPVLANFFLEQMGHDMPRKSLAGDALERLLRHSWPGNVRELMHVLERGAILSEERAEISADDICIRARSRN